MASLVARVTQNFNTQSALDEIESFFADKPQDSGAPAVKQSMEAIRSNIAWVAAHGESVKAWLKAH